MRMIFTLLLSLLCAGAAYADLNTVAAKGKTVDVEAKLVPEVENIVIFHSKAVYLSHQLMQNVSRYAARHKEVPILVVETDSASPAAKQHGVKTFPYVRYYDRKGKVRLEGAPAYSSLLKQSEQ